MRVLVIYAHPNPRSFNHAVLEAFISGLQAGGHEFDVVDLYGINFDPCFKLDDFGQFVGGQTPQDVLDQQEKVSRADALVFVSPVWWMGFPAILKGWIERVFSYGFAYELTEEGWGGKLAGRRGLLKQQKALVLNTTHFSESDYQSSGMREAMQRTVAEWTLQYPGIREVEHVFLYGVTSAVDETRRAYLERARDLGKKF